jgi:hypothetical protein
VGRVDGLFANSFNKAKTIHYICHHYKNNIKTVPVKTSSTSYENVTIPTYVVYTPEWPDSMDNIKAQFKGKNEFEITLVEAVKNNMGACSWYLSIRKIVEMAIANNDDVIVICKDDLKFTAGYSKEDFLQNIMEAFYQRTEMLAGGLGEFGIAIPVAKNRFWINAFHAAGFFVLYKSIFQKILEQRFDDNITAGQLFTKITNYKMALFPFIAIQSEWDIPQMTWDRIEDEASKLLFPPTENRFALVKSVYEKYCANKNKEVPNVT